MTLKPLSHSVELQELRLCNLLMTLNLWVHVFLRGLENLQKLTLLQNTVRQIVHIMI